VFGEADEIVATCPFWDFNQETMAGFHRQETQADDLPSGPIAVGSSGSAWHGLLPHFADVELLVVHFEPVEKCLARKKSQRTDGRS